MILQMTDFCSILSLKEKNIGRMRKRFYQVDHIANNQANFNTNNA